ncbi:MAG: hypothetical protein M0P94_04100 [Candidatus Absconditabacterales bacterium]|nr:hypothetical protein [Candidatus Absconditabacterales bacterium]
MKILIDKNSILSIENPKINKNKEYCHNLDGFEFCDIDKGVLVYHKKQLKIIHLKDLGDKMGVFMVGQRDEEINDVDLILESVENALKLFSGFDENTGEKYHFLAKYSENKMKDLNIKLQKLGSKIIVNKTEKGFCIKNKNEEELKYDPINFLFGLRLVYGDLNIKEKNLKSIKIQVPLFSAFQENEELIDECVNSLVDNNIFLKKNIQKTNDGVVYQLTSSDFELLEIFAKLYQSIEKGLKINKLTELEKIKLQLMDFIKSNNKIPNNGKKEVLEELEKGVIKILIKN